MKKIISFILALTLLLEIVIPPLTIYALEDQTPPIVETQNDQSGNLEVDLKLSLPIKNVARKDMHLTLFNRAGKHIDVVLDTLGITLEEQYSLGEKPIRVKVRKLDYRGVEIQDDIPDTDIYYFGVTFYGLPADTYQVSLKAPGYRDYTVSDIQIENYSKRVTLSNETGLFEIGDVDQNGTVDDRDIDVIIQHIKNKTYSETCDLNRDGFIDITDFAYIASIVNNRAAKVSIQNTNVIVDPDTVVETKAPKEGSVADLLKGNGISVTTENEAEIISAANPAIVGFAFSEPVVMEQIRIAPGQNRETSPKSLQIELTDENNKIETFYYRDTDRSEQTFTDLDDDMIKIPLNGQIAVKKVTIHVLETYQEAKIADIVKIEFLNNVYEKVLPPKMDIPTNLWVEPANKSALIHFQDAPNVTGYEIEIMENNRPETAVIYQTTYHTYQVSDLKNYKEYTVRVQSRNGNWKSGYSEAVTFMPVPTRKPPVPEGISITPLFNGLTISWKKMEDTLRYHVYYRQKGERKWHVKENITATNLTLNELSADTAYEIQISGVNDIGEGNRSLIHRGTTLSLSAPITTNYRLINVSKGQGFKTDHIVNIEYPSSTPEKIFAIVDDDFHTYWNLDSWDAGGYNKTSPRSPIVEFDEAYRMDRLIFTSGSNEPSNYSYINVYYWDQFGVRKEVEGVKIQGLTSKNGQKYYQVNFPEAIEAKKIQVNLALYWPGAPEARVRIREMKFYYYDSIEKDVAALFADDLHVSLKAEVTAEQIDALLSRLNTPDPVSGEYHPNRDIILADLTLASQLFQDKNLHPKITVVDQSISNKRNGHLGFAFTMNDYQPLGISVRAGETIAVYVGTKGTVMPQLVFTQFYGESSKWTTSMTLHAGQNIIVVPQIGNMDTERGGSLYVQYPLAAESKYPIHLRVSGGTEIPVLDIHDLSLETDEAEIRSRIADYLITLKAHLASLPEKYREDLANGLTTTDYDEKTSVLNATEIVTKNGMWSGIATSVLRGITDQLTTPEQEENRIYDSLQAFEQMMELFYRQKGLRENPDLDHNGEISSQEAKNTLPGSRINIRYMRMFDGAFMYAGGAHIGIESGSFAGLLKGRPNKGSGSTTATAGFFGWGISHEIGHVIDQNKMIYGETSNNIFSLLAQTNDDKAHSRLEQNNIYDSVYQKVTSSTKGIASNVFVSLGMFWQLHLAYDTNLTYTDTNSFYSRLNTYYRTTNYNEEPFKSADKNNLLIMLASQAAGRNLVPFFEKWGLEASQATKEYVARFPLETRALYYLNDDARRYVLNGGKPMNNGRLTATLHYRQGALENDAKTVTFDFSLTGSPNSAILGYEILRNGTPIGFTTKNTYTDHIGALNNRVVVYQVVAYDKLLNKTEPYTFDEIKIAHDGSVLKNNFTVSSNMTSFDSKGDEWSPAVTDESIDRLINGNSHDLWHGTIRQNLDYQGSTKVEDPYILIDFNHAMSISGIKYTAGIVVNSLAPATIEQYEIYVSSDKVKWTLAKKGTFKVTSEHPTEIIYFDREGSTGGNQLWTYNNIGYVKIVSVGGKSGISAAEIDVIAQPGDNVEIDPRQIGILDSHYYDQFGNILIEKGSVIIGGTYRGNPAYNIVLMKTATNRTIDGESIFFADIPDNAPLDEIASGTFVYALSLEDYRKYVGESIRANLYRVNDAYTGEGERLVSDSLTVVLPEEERLPFISIEE